MIHVLLIICHVIQCETGYYEALYLRSVEPMEMRTLTTQSINTSDRQPIRIFFDTNSLFNSSLDQLSCQNSNMQCSADAILDSNRLWAINQTIANVRSILEENINVTRLNSAINLSSYSFQGYKYPYGNLTGYDLYVAVIIRNFSITSSGLAYAIPMVYTSDEDRPYIGQIVLNSRRIPSAVQNLSSPSRQFFMTVMHELNHILSFSSTLFSLWHDANNSKYSSVFGTYSSTYSTYGITQTFIQTPGLKSWINSRFHAKSASTLNIGLELEDGGGSGTAGSHPNERLFLSDLMQGRTYGPGYLSQIFYYSLLDSGWYNPSPSLYEELVYMDTDLNPTATENEMVLISPPRTSFPPQYLCNDNSHLLCFYDYSYKGICGLASNSTISSFSSQNLNWYNPSRTSYIGQDELIDYTPVILPVANCRDSATVIDYGTESADFYGEVVGSDSMCAMSTLYKGSYGMTASLTSRCFTSWCGSDNRVRIIVGGNEYLCTEDGQEIHVSGYNGEIICPIASMACANREKRRLINVLSALPDRGPLDGKNLISLNGFGFGKFNSSALILSIGPVHCEVIQKDDSHILCKLSTTTPTQQSQILMEEQPFIGEVADGSINRTVIPNIYTFANRIYDAGTVSAKPALILMILLVISSVLLLFN